MAVATGILAVLAAMACFAWSVVRILIGPARVRALKHAGFAVLTFLGACVFLGMNLAPADRRQPTQQSNSLGASAPQTVEAASVTSTPHLLVEATYHPAKTMVALVVSGFQEGLEPELETLIRSQCDGVSFCSVGVWTDDKSAPRKLKMTAAQSSARLAQYAFSSQDKVDRMIWNCQANTSTSGDCIR